SITVAPASPIVLVQSASVAGTSVGALTQAFPAATTAGDLLLVLVRMSTTTQTVTVADTAGNPYLLAAAQAQSADGHQTRLYYARAATGGATTVTATFSATNNHPWLAVYEYRGVATLDQTGQAQGSSAAPTCATAATTSPTELVFAAVGLPSSSGVTVTAGAGYTLQQQDPVAGRSRAATEDLRASATGSFTPAFGLSGTASWSCVVATFAPAPAGVAGVAATLAQPVRAEVRLFWPFRRPR
ncbi:MAG TPA: hypothetical protein VGQ83_39155, partial [Polyangia bacterium]